MVSRDWAYHLTAVAVVSIWGMTFVSTKYLLNSGLSPVGIFLARFIIAYAGILVISHKKLFCNSLKDELMALLIGLSGGSAYFIVENIALEKSTASNVSLIVCTAPIFTLLISSFIDRTRLSFKVLAGLLVSMSGVAVLLFRGAGHIGFNPAGDLLALLGALLWSLYTIMLGYMMKRYSSSFITRKTFFYGTLTALPLLLLNDISADTGRLMKTDVILNLLFLSVVASLVCYFVWGRVIRKLGSVRTCNYLYINPVAAVLASVLFLGEDLTPMLLLGMALVFSGIYVSQKTAHSVS